MKWKEEYSTGNVEIDNQHKTLFAYSEDFREVLENGCRSETYEGFLEFLTMYTSMHFGFEEECMFANKCPFGEKNKNEHAVFIKIIKREIEAFQKDGFVPSRASKLLDVIDAWLDSHIGRIDVQLKSYIAQ